MSFTRRVEDFSCEHCGSHNVGTGYTNHCSHCLYSKHVDVHPGDRAESCGGLMAPIDVEQVRDELVLVHRCKVCRAERRCRASTNDDPAAITDVLEAKARGG